MADLVNVNSVVADSNISYENQMIPVPEAIEKILNSAERLDTTSLPIEDALNYYLVDDVTADRAIPPFNRVAMDGFAVQSSDFQNCTEREFQIIGHIQTGISSDLVVTSGTAVQIMTGAPCPPGADAVVKIEDADIKRDSVKLVVDKINPGTNVATMGEDAAEGKVLVEAGSLLSTSGIAICASVGKANVEVYRKPKVRVISTGTEIISPHEQPLPHQIRDCNSFTARVMSQQISVDAQFLGIGEDDKDVLSKMIQEGLQSDILILSGGVSMGEYDHIPKLLDLNGVEKIFHKIKVKPGKPVWFGKTDSCYVFGLPGNPVSVQTCYRLFVEPLIRKLSGCKTPTHQFLKLPLSVAATSKAPREHYMPGKFVEKNGTTAIEPVIIKGSGDYSNFYASQGIFRFPADISSMSEGQIVEFLPWREIW